MLEKYNPNLIEKEIQHYWRKINAYKVKENPKNIKKKFYACSMLPYPSGKLHMGHVRNYTINDVMARYLRMNGYNVLMPMGWDAFGMPAENAAIENNVSPSKWTLSNIDSMKKQMEVMGFAIDWSRELKACSPDYYRWNQWMFLKMLKKNIIYKKTGVVNWDPVDKTVLANEQVIDGRGWRSGALIEKKEIPMYFARITNYAEDLLKSLNSNLSGWPEKVKIMQNNWIGKSEGIRFAFKHNIKDEKGNIIDDGKMWVFTTRIDTIMGVTFCAISPEHPISKKISVNNFKLKNFIKQCSFESKSQQKDVNKEKKGVFTGLKVIHPLTEKKIDLWIGNYVLMTYGDGAVMGVPAHDERDFYFAKKYNLPIQPVIKINNKEYDFNKWQDYYSHKNLGKCINSGKYDGLSLEDAVKSIYSDLKKNQLGEKKISYRLRDWGISRQRYWGTPIPIIHCKKCGDVPVPEKDLPVILPEDCIPDGSGNLLEKNEDFFKVNCPVCRSPSRRETDTMDTFVDSSWYYMRYCSPKSKNSIIDSNVNYWMPVDHYIGGIEHAVLHLLYARFWTKVMLEFDLIKFNEPFKNLLTQGMVLNETYFNEDKSGKKTWHNPKNVVIESDDKGRLVSAKLLSNGLPVTIGGKEKMSKSKNNGVDPQEIIDKYGADTSRLFTIFAAPPEQTLEWSESGVEGAHRFLKRTWSFAYKNKSKISGSILFSKFKSEKSKETRRQIYQIFSQANLDYERVQYNTVVSACMKMLNVLEDIDQSIENESKLLMTECFSIFLRILYPISPHITHSLWKELGYQKNFGEILDTNWPKIDEDALEQVKIKLVVQINGKLRGNIVVKKNLNESLIKSTVLNDSKIKKYIINKPKRIIIVPGKLVNIVI